jgi:integrase
VANHRCSIYVRNTSGDRKRYPAGPGVAYPPSTTFQLRFGRSWTTLAVSSYQEALVKAKEKELELFRTDSQNYTRKASTLRILPKPVFVEAQAVVPEPPAPVVRDTLGKTMDEYLEQLAVEGSKGSVGMYSSVFRQFYNFVTQDGMITRTLKSITKSDVLRFAAYWKSQGQKPITIHNKIVVIACLLKRNGIHGCWVNVKFEPKDVVSYSPEEVKQLLAAATPSERLLISFFVSTGLRKSEVRNAEWGQVNFIERVFTVRQARGYMTKSRRARYIPLPDDLLEKLREHKKSAKCELIFPSPKNKPNYRLYESFVALAERAGVPCNGLHQLRRTFCTTMARNGSDLFSLRNLMGHANISTTERYVSGLESRSKEARDRANAAFAQYA